jgi:peroxiredoxin
MKKLLSISCLLLFSALNFALATDADTTKAKSALPAVTLKDVNGQSVNFAEYANTGQITIVSFWATWCKPCIVELTNIDNVFEDWQKKYNVRLIAVSVDDSRTAPKVKPFVTSKNWPFDVLIDLNSDLRRAMNVTNPPTTFLLDKTGKIVYTHTGYLEGDENELEKKIAELSGK